ILHCNDRRAHSRPFSSWAAIPPHLSRSVLPSLMYADTSVPSAVALRSFWVGLCVAEEDRLHRGSDDFKIGRFLAILTICPLFATSATRLVWIRDFGLIEIRSSRPADVTELDIINNPAASRSRHWRRPRPRALDDVDFAAIHQFVGNA